MVRVRTLQRAALPSELLHHVSPASSHSRRVATNVAENGEDCTIYIASGVHVYGIKIELRETTVEAGKEDMLIPVDGQVADAWQLQQCPHRAEIQSIALSASQNDGGVLLGSVDSNGHLVVTCLDSTTSRGTISSGPQDAGMGEGWWAGIVFSQSHLGLAAVARGMAKTIDFYDKDIHVRTLRTLQHPTSLTFLYGSGSSDNPPLLAVTEGPQVSIWDIRQGERGGCVHRLFGTSSGEPLYAISSSSDGLVATGGAERSIVVYDAYKWTARSRWTNCLKFEINGLFFSSADPGLIYVHGIDYEVLCGPWNRESSQESLESTFTFRGDSRWLGVDKCLNMDVLAGWCESGTIFAGHIVEGI
ncbi:unnamed protein product [Sphagnum jensenii]|uniref:Uncharacterized protein n=1 Tax=Sphagnum jensenii TaxID=128206 RepID=A0ABP1BVF7_9BRYO